jgi:hypothetical protein
MLIEEAFLDALYMTIIIDDGRFREIHDLTQRRIFTIVLGGWGLFLCPQHRAKMTIEVIRRKFTGRKSEKRLKDLKDHYIVYGYGRM